MVLAGRSFGYAKVKNPRQWIGHSERIAQDHYILATDDSYIARAAGGNDQ